MAILGQGGRRNGQMGRRRYLHIIQEMQNAETVEEDINNVEVSQLSNLT